MRGGQNGASRFRLLGHDKFPLTHFADSAEMDLQGISHSRNRMIK